MQMCTGNIHELEDMGLLERHPDPSDSRAKLIDFTAQGKQFIAELGGSTETVWDQYTALLGEKKLTATIESLRHLLADQRKESYP